MTNRITRREVKARVASFDEWYQTIHFGFLLDTRNPYRNLLKRLLRVRSKEDRIRDALVNVTGKRVVEIGCNAGLYTLTASCRGASYALGVDRSPVAIEQAKAAETIARALGWPVGSVDFQLGDINQRLSLLDEMDVLIAGCVIYHLGPTGDLKARIRSSALTTILLQGNTARLGIEDQYNVPGSPHFEEGKQTWGNYLSGIPGMAEFVESCGFEVAETRDVASQFPVVVAKRAARGP